MLTFRNYEDALRSGYTPAVASKVYGRHKGCTIVGFDVSGLRPLGLRYALKAVIPDNFTPNYMGVVSDRHFGESMPVQLQVINTHKATEIPAREHAFSTVQVFNEKDLEEALRDARGWIDHWFQYHPKAMEQSYLRQRQERSKQAVA